MKSNDEKSKIIKYGVKSGGLGKSEPYEPYKYADSIYTGEEKMDMYKTFKYSPLFKVDFLYPNGPNVCTMYLTGNRENHGRGELHQTGDFKRANEICEYRGADPPKLTTGSEWYNLVLYTWHHVFMGYNDDPSTWNTYDGVSMRDASNWRGIWDYQDQAIMQLVERKTRGLMISGHEKSCPHLGSPYQYIRTYDFNFGPLTYKGDYRKDSGTNIKKSDENSYLEFSEEKLFFPPTYDEKTIRDFEDKMKITFPELAIKIYMSGENALRSLEFKCDGYGTTLDCILPLTVPSDSGLLSVEEAILLHGDKNSDSYIELPDPTAVPFAWNTCGELLYMDANSNIWRYYHEWGVFDKFTMV